MKGTAIILAFIAFSALGQGSPSFQLGVGTHTDHIWGLTHEFDSIKINGETRRGDNRLSIHLYYNIPLRPRLNFEFGMKAYHISYGYFVAQKYPPFGFVHKGGNVLANTLSIPVNLEWMIGRFFYLKGGGMATLGKLSKHENAYFKDTPAVNDYYNTVPEHINPHFLSLAAGAGLRWRNFDFSYIISETQSPLSRPILVNGSRYQIYDRMATHHIDLSYHLTFKRN